jgi:hypothetical protein
MSTSFLDQNGTKKANSKELAFYDCLEQLILNTLYKAHLTLFLFHLQQHG